MDLALFLTSQVLAVGLVFARIGSALAFMPGFGERVIPLRFRLLVALVLSAALAPATPVDAVTIDSPLLLVPLLAALAVRAPVAAVGKVCSSPTMALPYTAWPRAMWSMRRHCQAMAIPSSWTTERAM